MNRPNNRRTDPGGLSGDTLAVVMLSVTALVAGIGVWIAVTLGYQLAGRVDELPADAFARVFGVFTGKVAWLPASTWIAAAVFVVGLAIGGLLLWFVLSGQKNRTRVDRSAQYMGIGKDVEALTEKAAQATAQRLGVAGSVGVPIGTHLYSGKPLFGSWEDMHIDIWGPRTGKALDFSTKVLTPHGWVEIGTLTRGCRVIGRDGQAHTVTGVYPQGVRPAYRMTLSDGTSILCDAEHIWTVRPKIRQDKRHPEAWREWTTAQLMRNGLRRASGGAKYYLPIVEPVEFEGVLPAGVPSREVPDEGRGGNLELRPDAGTVGVRRAAITEAERRTHDVNWRPLDPYLLGVLIGDGGLSQSSVKLSTADEEMIEILTPRLPGGTNIVKVRGSDYDYRIRGNSTGRNRALSALRGLGLMGHTALTKFIPEAYLLAPVPDRWALLAGLLDTDGSIDTTGIIEFSTSSPRLAADVKFLVQALGGTVTTTVRETTHNPSSRLLIRLPKDTESPFWLTRKRARWEAASAKRRSSKPVRAIVSIEPEGEAEMVCISIDAPDHLYVAEECIVTHNTTSRAVPAILDAPGACLVTSNKRDVVDATRDVRAARGPINVFDPQGIALEEPTWYWLPLSYVTDEVRAAKLAEHFASGSREAGAKTDAYFEAAGQDLLAGLLLAAALDERPITDVYRWITRPTEREPVFILKRHDMLLMADQVAGIINAPEKQRGGVYGTAQQMVSCLTNRSILKWITREEGDTRPEFSPTDFVRRGGTLYSLSKEGKGTAGPLVTALTVAVVEAAEELAVMSPGGRLATPLLGVLDEAANVCRWRSLPDLYSHYGSRGIVLMTILQSWSQGVEVWGESGMRKLWSASNVKCYGGGVSETAFLEDLSRLIGEHERVRTSVSSGRGQRSVSSQVQRERTMDVADLGAMPKGRALVIASGSRPTLVRTQPWMRGQYAEQVRASIAAHDPQGARTLTEAFSELNTVEQHESRVES